MAKSNLSSLWGRKGRRRKEVQSGPLSLQISSNSQLRSGDSHTLPMRDSSSHLSSTVMWTNGGEAWLLLQIGWVDTEVAITLLGNADVTRPLPDWTSCPLCWMAARSNYFPLPPSLSLPFNHIPLVLQALLLHYFSLLHCTRSPFPPFSYPYLLLWSSYLANLSHN